MTAWRDLPVESRIFAAIAAYFVVAGVVYVMTGDDESGSTLLIGAAAFGFGSAAWFTRHLEAARAGVLRQDEGGDEDEGVDALYLPHASVWPLALGAGSVLVIVGLAVGIWMLIPGALLTGRSLVGLASESRRRA